MPELRRPSNIQRTYVEVSYSVTDKGLLYTGRVRIRPSKVHIEQVMGQPLMVIIKGPIIRKDGEVSTRTGQVIFGRFGAPLSDAPPWVTNLAEKFERMVKAYA